MCTKSSGIEAIKIKLVALYSYWKWYYIEKRLLKDVRGVLQKFCIVQPFPTCGNTVATKLCAHVAEGISSAHVKFCHNGLKIT